MDNRKETEILKQALDGFDVDYYFNQSNTELLVKNENLLEIALILNKDKNLNYEILIDVIAVDYLVYGNADWKTNDATNTGYSRAVKPTIIPDVDDTFKNRFALFYQLLSLTRNTRLTIKVFSSEINPPSVPSLVSIWNGANWFEREAFDLMGIHFEGHPDLRRILTDYGFIGHPFRKDFPTNGNLEVVYDDEKEEVVYQPVSIKTRPGVPRVIRKDND